MRITRNRSISLILVLTLLLTSMAGLIGEKVQAATTPAPMGEVVYSHFGYHDTWTTQWQGRGDDSSDNGKNLASNLTVAWDRGKPNTPQGTNIELLLSSFPGATNAKEFKEQYIVLPLQPTALTGAGYTSAQAENILTGALNSGSNMGSERQAFDDKYVNKGVTNYSINNDGITLSGGTLKIPLSYSLKTPIATWGEDLTTKVGDLNSGLPAKVAQYKADGKSYADFKANTLQFYVLPESSMRHLWDNGTLANGTVGWRWYMPFTP